MKEGINVLSLFDGMSCGMITLERAGIKVNKYYASEICKYATKVSEYNYPNVVRLGDVTKVHYTNLGLEIDTSESSMRVIETDIDLLIGGSPCQGFSFAGKQLNFEDPRSKLFFEFVRLKNECNPKYFFLENVVMKKEYQDIISEHLGVQPIKINSSLVSAQNRKRLYWTNIPNIEQPIDKGILLQDILELEGVGVIKNLGKLSERNEKSMCLDASYYKGADNHGQRTQILYDDMYRKLTPVECERLQTVPDNYTSCVSNSQRYKMLGNRWTIDVIAHFFKNID